MNEVKMQSYFLFIIIFYLEWKLNLVAVLNAYMLWLDTSGRTLQNEFNVGWIF